MSDSQPPYGGPDPDDGWDLEGLLSGDSVWLPDGMRPVAAALSALRGAPLRSELAAEASARAEFRRAVPASQGGPPAPSAPLPPQAALAQHAPLVQPESAAQLAPLVQASNGHTLILPARPAGGPPAPARPRHSHRRPPRRGRWQPNALAGVAAGAAALVIVGGIALAGGFSGTAPQPGQAGRSSSAAGAPTSAGGTSAGPGLEGSATKVPTAHPTHSTSGQQPSPRSTLCRQYWAFFAHPESSASWGAEKATLQQLSEMAGSQWNINRYCAPYYQGWGFAQPAAGGQGQQGAAGPQGDNQVAPPPGQNDGNGDQGKKNAGKDAGNGKSPHGNGNGGGNGNQQ